jgi:hypothetical protein
LYVSLPFAEDESSYAFSVSLSDLVEELIDVHKQWDDHRIHEQGDKVIIRALSAQFRDLADRLDASLFVEAA